MTDVPDPTSSAAPTSPSTLWEQQVVGDRWTFYAERFDKMIADGTDLEGEARFIDAMAARGSAALDAGCGTGRIAAALVRMGHRAIGVDKDAGLIDIARKRYPGAPYLTCDLMLLNRDRLQGAGGPTEFDIIALPGNVMVYLAPGSERDVLGNLAGLLRPAGRIVAGFATNRDYTPHAFRADAEAIGLTVEHHFATWQLDPVTDSSDWAVIVLRRQGIGADNLKTTQWSPATRWPRCTE
jgi:SAM-dependent methyltransferase